MQNKQKLVELVAVGDNSLLLLDLGEGEKCGAPAELSIRRSSKERSIITYNNL